MKDNSFKMAIAASVITHVVIFSYKPFSLVLPNIKPLQKFEVSYYKIVSEPRKDDVKMKLKGEIKVAKVQTKKEDAKLHKAESEQKIKAAPVKKKETKAEEKKVKKEAEQKKVLLQAAPQPASQTQAYLDYYEILRQKIKGCIIYPEISSGGEVHLAFAILQDGTLKEVLIDNSKSAPNQLFRDAAVRGVQDASPFPPFPKGLPQDTQSFNVIISFEPKK